MSLFALAIVNGIARAENRALLIGIGSYPKIETGYWLDGPRNDVTFLKGILLNTWGFRTENIATLIDGQATRQNILSQLERLATAARPGDFLLVYFSGHGTSSYDPIMKRLGLDPFTGALVPADFRFGDPGEMQKTLIVGSRDLAPVFKRLEKDLFLLVVVDACYSGYTVRALRSPYKWKSRNLDIQWEDMTGDAPGEHGADTRREPEFPYTNTVYLSAASMRETAVDITPEAIKDGNATIDGLPHGAFTDALLRGLGGAADTNGDSDITSRELHGFVRQAVSESFPHTPGLLYPKTHADLLDRPLLKVRWQGNTVEALTAPGRELTVKLEMVPGEVGAAIAAIDGVKVVSNNQDLLILKDLDRYWLYMPSGYPLAAYPATDTGGVIDRLRRQVNVKRLVAFAPARQSFNVYLDMIGPDGVLTDGEIVGFKVRAERDAYLFLVNIDSLGNIYVIYPFTPDELRLQPSGQTLDLSDLGKVQSPFGIEYIKAMAFSQKATGLDKLVGAEFSPSDSRFEVLMKILDGDLAQETLQVKTSGRSDIVKVVK